MPSSSKTASLPKGKKVIKKAVMKAMKSAGAKKRPAGNNLNPDSLGKLGEATLDQKIALYSKKGGDNVDGFLQSLAKEQREALWQRFKYARQENPELNKTYDQVAKGTKSMENKKSLLNIFLKLGQTCKGQPYFDALTQMTFNKGTKKTEEWVPFATICKKYGLQELMRRVKKGSVAVRQDPSDLEEYQFQDVRTIDVEGSFETHSANVNKRDKVQIEDYMKVRAASSISGFAGSSAAKGFMLTMGAQKAKSSKGVDEPEDDGEDGSPEAQELEDKADLLTQFKNMGPKGKTAAQRVDEMLVIMKALLEKHPKSIDKDVHVMINKRVVNLQNLKKEKKLDLDTCKAALMDAAATIKKVNKLS
jgi:hypothetical protein